MEDMTEYFNNYYFHGKKVTPREYWEDRADELKRMFTAPEQATITPDDNGITVRGLNLTDMVGLSAYAHLCCFRTEQLKDGGFRLS